MSQLVERVARRNIQRPVNIDQCTIEVEEDCLEFASQTKPPADARQERLPGKAAPRGKLGRACPPGWSQCDTTAFLPRRLQAFGICSSTRGGASASRLRKKSPPQPAFPLCNLPQRGRTGVST